MDTYNDIDEELRKLALSADEEKDLLLAFQRIGTPLPDIDEEWGSVSRRMRMRRRAVLYAIAGVAAAACVVLAFLLAPRFAPSPRHYVAVGGRDSVVLPQSVAPAPAKVVAEKTAPAPVEQKRVEPVHDIVAETACGQDRHIVLPDGSRVWLNASSRLIYPSRFEGKERRVYLSGEGYFEVSHDASHPFVVDNNFFTTTVLGTVFNVEAYSRNEANLVLVSGKVAVELRGDSAACIVEPGQQAVFDDSGTWFVSAVNTYPYTQRKDGYFYFDQQPLRVIMADIGRWYGKTVVFENPDLGEMKLHFVAERKDSLGAVLESINRMDTAAVAVEKGEIVVR